MDWDVCLTRLDEYEAAHRTAIPHIEMHARFPTLKALCSDPEPSSLTPQAFARRTLMTAQQGMMMLMRSQQRASIWHEAAFTN